MKTFSSKNGSQTEFDEMIKYSADNQNGSFPLNSSLESQSSTSSPTSSLSSCNSSTRKHVFVTAYQPDHPKQSKEVVSSPPKILKLTSSISNSTIHKESTSQDSTAKLSTAEHLLNSGNTIAVGLKRNISFSDEVTPSALTISKSMKKESTNSMQSSKKPFVLTKSVSAPPVPIKAPTETEDDFEDALPTQSQTKSIFSFKKKRSIVYNARPWQKEHDDSKSTSGSSASAGDPKSSSASPATRSDEDLMPPPKSCGVTRAPGLHTSKSFPSTSTGFSRSSSDASALKRKLAAEDADPPSVRNVKEAYECQERGEEQTLLDDIEYLIEGMRPSLSNNARALSTCTLITKCLEWNFRRKLRNPKILGCILRNMADVTKDTTLSFCVAVFLYVLTRNADARFFDKPTLYLLMQLLKGSSGPMCAVSKGSTTSKVKEEQDGDKMRLKLMQLVDDFHKSICRNPAALNTFCKHLTLNRQMTVSDLLLELLLSLGHRKNADLFKNELRMNGALDCIASSIISAIDYIGDDLGPQFIEDSVLDRLKRIFHYLRLLEDITFKNSENQLALVNFKERTLLDALIRCLRFCINNVSNGAVSNEAKRVLKACLTSIFRLFLNISCNNEESSDRLGGCPHLLELTVYTALQVAEAHIDENSRTDIYVISLALLVNLAEHCSENRARIMHLQVTLNDQEEETEVPAIQGLVDLFVRLEKNIQEHEFEQVTPDDVSAKGAAAPSSISSSTSPSPANQTAPLKFHLVESANHQKKKPLSSGDFSCDAFFSSGGDQEDDFEFDSNANDVRGADIEFETNSHEEREQLQKQLSSAEIHMKHSIVCAYIALLLGCILQDNFRYAARIRHLLPERNFRVLAYMLAKLYNFLQITEAMDEAEQKSVMKIVNVLESQDNHTAGGSSSTL